MRDPVVSRCLCRVPKCTKDTRQSSPRHTSWMRSRRSSQDETTQTPQPWTDSTESEERSRGLPWRLAGPAAVTRCQRSSCAPSVADSHLGPSACHLNACPCRPRLARGLTALPATTTRPHTSWTPSLKLYRRRWRRTGLGRAARRGSAPTTSLLSWTRKPCRGKPGTRNIDTTTSRPGLL